MLEGAAAFTHLEPRQLLSAAVVDDFDDVTVNQNAPGTVVELAGRFGDTNLTGTIVKFQSVLGTFYAQLLDSRAPNNVTNFLRYADGDLYDNSIIHQNQKNDQGQSLFLVGGGFGNAPSYTTVPNFPPVVIEPDVSNLRGTIAASKVGNAPNFSLSQWFVNVRDNTALDRQDGGYTVFGRVLGDGMTVVDAMAAVSVFDASALNASFDKMPLRNFTLPGTPTAANTISFTDVSRADKFTYTVTAADPTLVSAQIIDGRLSLSYVTNRSGTTTVTVRATAVDSTTATPNFIEDTLTVNVVAVPPTLGGVESRNSVVGQSALITLRANDALDSDRRVESVQYWYDSDLDGQFNPGRDQLVVSGTNSAERFSATFQAAGFGLGTHRFYARAVDSDGLFSAVVSTTVRVEAFPPSVGAVKASVRVLPSAGTPIILTASSVRDRDGTIVSVQYFKDDGDGAFDASTDTLLGSSDNVPSKFALSVDTTAFSPATYTFFARSLDNAGLFSEPASVTLRVNAPPTVTGFDASSDSAERAGSFQLIAGAAADDVLVRTVDFWRDVDANGSLDTAVDRLAGKGKRNAEGQWTATVLTKGFSLGDTTFFAVATDSDRGTSAPVSTVVTITNAAPTMPSVAAKPLIIANRGENVTLTGKSPKDKDGTIVNAQYFLDDGNGAFDPEADTLLGESTSRGFSLVASTGGFSVGLNTVFAWATDNSGTHSAPVSVQVRINAPPVIESIVAPDVAVVNGTPFTLAANGVTDPDGTVKGVDFFIDLNGDGEFQTTDRLLGKGRAGAAGVYSLTTSVRGFAPGVYSVFARATDAQRGIGAIAEGEILIG
ncbi:MAG: peptidylprolyl isomerase [Phycisphaerales bacterium]